MKLHLPPRLRASLLTALLAVPTLLCTPASAGTIITENQTGGSYEYNGNVTLNGAVFEDIDSISVDENDTVTPPEAGDLTLINGAQIDGVNRYVDGNEALGSIEVRGKLQVGASDGSSSGIIQDVVGDVWSYGVGDVSYVGITVTGAGSKIADIGGRVGSRGTLEVSAGGVISDVGNLRAGGNMTVNGGTLENATCGKDDQGQDFVGTVGGGGQ